MSAPSSSSATPSCARPLRASVSAVFAEAFEEVKPQEAVMRLIDPSEIEMIVSVPESLISFVPYVIDIRATFDAFPGVEIPAEVSEIGSRADPRARAPTRSSSCSRRRRASPFCRAWPAAFAASLAPRSPSQLKGVVIPLSAAFSPDDATGSFVWVVNERRRPCIVSR